MRSYLILSVLIFFLIDYDPVRAQSKEVTTFMLVRHAEKVDHSEDPNLSPEGYERAELLAKMLSKTNIDAVYSTKLTRTTETVRKIAEQNEIDIQFYDVHNPEETASGWIEDHRGKVILISGHSNTTPTFANELLGRNHFKDNFDESDFGNLLIITITESKNSRLLHLRY